MLGAHARAVLAPLFAASAKHGLRVNGVAPAFTRSMPRSGPAASIANSEHARDFPTSCRSSTDFSTSAAEAKFCLPELVSNSDAAVSASAPRLIVQQQSSRCLHLCVLQSCPQSHRDGCVRVCGQGRGHVKHTARPPCFPAALHTLLPHLLHPSPLSPPFCMQTLRALDTSTRGYRTLPTHRSAAGAAAASGPALLPRARSLAGLWSIGPLGASMRLMSTDVAAGAPSASTSGTAAQPLHASSGFDATEPACAWQPPSVVLVKVGDGGKWSTIKLEKLQDMDRSLLLEALVDSKVFGPDLKDVKISGCTVDILKGELPVGVDEPTAADEAPDKVLELKGAKKVSAVAESAGTGDQLCIRVRLPGAAPAAKMGELPATR